MKQGNDNATAHRADTYDSQILRTIPFYDQFHEQTIHLISAHNAHPGLWLDTGCGTGTLVQRCIPQFPHTRFILADPSPQMLQVAAEKLSSLQSHILAFYGTSTQNLQLENSVDVVTAIQAHHYLSKDDRIKATAVCYEALREGGLFITFENISQESTSAISLGKSMWGDYQRRHGKNDEEVFAHLQRFGTEYYPISVCEHLSLYRDCGFKTVALLWYSYMQAGFYCIK